MLSSNVSIGAGSFAEASHHLFIISPEVTTVHLALTLITAFIVLFGLFSGFIKEKLYVGEAILATIAGVIFSQYVGGVFAPSTWAGQHEISELTLELTRAVIALSVFAVGVELPKAYVLRHWRSLAILLGPVMICGWMISAGLMYAIIPGLDFLPALVVAAGVTPTDPILASSVVGKGKFAQEHVPAHIRHVLQAESGSNDGAAFPFLYLALFLLMRDGKSVGDVVGYWVALVLLYQIILGTVIGASVGILARKALKFSKRRKLIDRESMVAMYVAMALLVTGLTTLAGSDDLLAAFAAGCAFAWDDWFTESIEDSNFSSTIDLLSNCTIFIYLGATIPFSAWSDPILTLTPWRLVLLSLGILVLRRIPVILLLHKWIPDIKTFREASFAAHFGPMGVGAIFISTLAQSKLPTPNVPPENAMDILALSIQPITYFIVLSSILVHGLTISFFSLSRRVHSRVQSISRTFTASGANGGADEPSWMSRVKRVAQGEEIVVNRDDDDEVDELEKGEKEGASDQGTLAMFGAPSRSNKSSKSSASSPTEGTRTDDEAKEEETEKETRSGSMEERRRENEEHPPDNVLESSAEREEREDEGVDHIDENEHVVSGAEGGEVKVIDCAKEEKFCAADETRIWEEGHQVVVDHGDGAKVTVHDLDPSPESINAAKHHPHLSLLHIPHQEIQNEKADPTADLEGGAVKRAATKIIRRGNLLGAATSALIKGDGLTKEQKEDRKKEKMERDKWCRKEQRFCDREGDTSGSATPRIATASGAARSSRRQWVEGNKLVTETADGENVQVRELSAAERQVQVGKHLEALKKLGVDIESELSRLFKPTLISTSLAPKSVPSTSVIDSSLKAAEQRPDLADDSEQQTIVRTGVSLERTERVPDSEEDESDEDTPAQQSPPQVARSTSSAIQSVRQMLTKRNRSPSGTAATSSPRAITFANGVDDKPVRSTATTGLPMRRVPTSEATSIRFAEGA